MTTLEQELNYLNKQIVIANHEEKQLQQQVEERPLYKQIKTGGHTYE